VNAKAIVIKTANKANKAKQTKIMRAGRAVPLYIRKDNLKHNFAKKIGMMIFFWAVRVGRVEGDVLRQIFLESNEGGDGKRKRGQGGEVCTVCR
jgi:hypothetical protein